MKKTFLLTLSAALLCGISASAGNGSARYTVTAGVSQPIGQFAASGYEDNALVSPRLTRGSDGAAVTGFNAGIRRSVQLRDDIGWFLSAELFYNRLNSSLDNRIGEYYTTGFFSYTQVQVDKPAYYNIPLMIGAVYSPGRWFVEAAAGADLREISPYKVDFKLYYGAEGSYKSHYDASVRPAAQIGAGIRLAENYTLGAWFSYLGSAGFREIRTETLNSFSSNYDYRSGTLSAMTLSVKLGYTF